MLTTILAIGSVALGFVCIAGAFMAVMRKKPLWIPIVLGIAALILVTAIPVVLAVFFAATTSS